MSALPESRVLQFDCGVKVQLGFAAEFSNIMIIYTRILETPTDISTCSAQLSEFTEVRSVSVFQTLQTKAEISIHLVDTILYLNFKRERKG